MVERNLGTGWLVHSRLLFFRLQLVRRDRLARARLRVCVVRRPAGPFLRVLLFPPLGPPVLEPDLFLHPNKQKLRVKSCHRIQISAAETKLPP